MDFQKLPYFFLTPGHITLLHVYERKFKKLSSIKKDDHGYDGSYSVKRLHKRKFILKWLLENFMMDIHISELCGQVVAIDFMNQFIRLYKYCDKYDQNFYDRNISWIKGVNECIENFERFNIELIFVFDKVVNTYNMIDINRKNLSSKERKLLYIPSNVLLDVKNELKKKYCCFINENEKADKILEDLYRDGICNIILTDDKGIVGKKIKVKEPQPIGSELSNFYTFF